MSVPQSVPPEIGNSSSSEDSLEEVSSAISDYPAYDSYFDEDGGKSNEPTSRIYWSGDSEENSSSLECKGLLRMTSWESSSSDVVAESSATRAVKNRAGEVDDQFGKSSENGRNEEEVDTGLSIAIEDTPESSHVNPCRICLSSSCSSDLLISPCNCTGTLRNVHVGCLERWLTLTNTDSCEICKVQFELVKINKTWRDFFIEPSGVTERRRVFTILAKGYLFITPIMISGTYLVIKIAFDALTFGFMAWAIFGFVCGSFAGLFILLFIIGGFLVIREIINNWRREYSTVKLVISPESTDTPIRPEANLSIDENSSNEPVFSEEHERLRDRLEEKINVVDDVNNS